MVDAGRGSSFFATFLGVWLLALPSVATSLVQVTYPDFTIWLDCAKRGAVVAYYEVGRDSGNIDTDLNFIIDENHKDCQQTSTETYKRPKHAQDQYDRGHLVPANHLDGNEDAYRASYFLTNAVPQERKLNRYGTWRKTEDFIECWRDKDSLEVWIGVIWGDESVNDHFVQSRGIATPDAFVKMVYRPGKAPEDGKAIAWLLPNQFVPKEELNDSYNLVPAKKVESIIGRVLNLPGVDKTQKAVLSDWQDVTNCNP